MKSLGLCYALTIGVASALLAACDGPLTPISAPGEMQRTAITGHADRGRSWMRAGKSSGAHSAPLLYISAQAPTAAGAPRTSRLRTPDLVEPLGYCVARAVRVRRYPEARRERLKPRKPPHYVSSALRVSPTASTLRNGRNRSLRSDRSTRAVISSMRSLRMRWSSENGARGITDR